MRYRLELGEDVAKKLNKLDSEVSHMILKWVKKNIIETENPRLHGKLLPGDLKGLWRYLVGDYQLLVDIIDLALVIIAIDVGHRREIYR